MLDRNSDAVIPEARCRAGSPMPRGERIAKPTGWGQPTWSVFVFVLQAEEQRASDAPAHTLRRIRRLVSHTRSDRKSTRLNSSHSQISYAVFCLKKKKKLKARYASLYRNRQYGQLSTIAAH